MVSIQGALTLAALAVGVVLFFGAGGFAGVGSKIGGFFGGGLSQFSSSLTSAFTGGLFGGSTNPATGGVNNENVIVDTSTGTIGPPPRTGTEEFDPIGNLTGNLKGLQNILDTINNLFAGFFQQRGDPFTVTSGRSVQSFATALNPPIVQLGPKSRGTEFGGFINAQTQLAAGEALLAANKLKFPEFF